VVFQDARLFPHRSVRGNLLYGRHLRRERIRRDDTTPNRADAGADACDRIVSILGIEPLLERRVTALSGGERQRIAIGRALLSEPDVLLLDEPLASVDAARRGAILAHLRRVRDDLATPMLYVSHDLAEILQLTDRLVLMDSGRTVAHGRFHELALDGAGLEVMHGHGLTNVLPCRVEAHDAEAGLTRLTLPSTTEETGPHQRDTGTGGGTGTGNNAPAALAAAAGAHAGPAHLNAPLRPSLAPGASVHIAIRPSDIALARTRVEGVSIRNQLPGTVARVTQHAGRAIVEVAVAETGTPLLVEVSLRTVREMALQPGAPAWALIKSNAVAYV